MTYLPRYSFKSSIYIVDTRVEVECSGVWEDAHQFRLDSVIDQANGEEIMVALSPRQLNQLENQGSERYSEYREELAEAHAEHKREERECR